MKKEELCLFAKRVSLAFFVSVIMIFYSCQNSDENIIDSPDDEPVVISEDLRGFTAAELGEIKNQLEASGIDMSHIDIEGELNSTRTINELLLRVIKVTTKSPHPADPTRQIDLSGVLLVPRFALTELQLVVAPVPTFTTNGDAPSNVFQHASPILNDSLSYLYFWLLQAYEGFAVLLPDYPGFGDSYQQCFIPYVVQEPMVRAAIDITKASQLVLAANGYRYNRELIVTGYSQGAFVATSLTRELETNPSHNLPVKLLVSGGTPANLKYIADVVRHSDELATPYLMPYAVCGFHSNGYPDIVISNILTEPSASDAYTYFDGMHSDLGDAFPSHVSELFTQNFIDNLDSAPELASTKNALLENSIQPWVNRCKMVMVHGAQDVTVYYQNAKDFADHQNAIGGNVTFSTVLGNHTTSIIQYYLEASANLLLYK